MSAAPKSVRVQRAKTIDVPDDGERHGLSPLDIIGQWRSEGALERLCTGWETFDRATRGGFVLGRLALLLGAPNGYKTATLGCLAWRWLHEDVAVGVLAVDEDAHDFLTRLAVMSGVSLDDAENRSGATLSKIEEALADLPLRLYGPEWTIEDAAADLHAFTKRKGIKRGVLLADSLQTIRCDASLDSSSLRVFVGANVGALSRAAARHRIGVIATGEIPRGHYDGKGNDMAATKESGAGEYAAKIQCVLRRAKRNDSLVHVSVPKIKRGSKDETEFYLRFDRATHSLTEDSSGASVATAPTETTALKLRERIIEVTRPAPTKGQELDSPSAIAKAAGGKYQPAFAIAKALIADGTIKMHKGSYRSRTEART